MGDANGLLCVLIFSQEKTEKKMSHKIMEKGNFLE